MHNNKFLKLFLICFTLFLFISPLMAAANAGNTLSKIYIDRLDSNVFGINLFFDNKYSNSAFIQQKEKGSYYVFIPDTQMGAKNTSLIYKYGSDKSNIRINAEEKPFYKEGGKSSYIRLTVSVTPDYSIKILSNTVDNYSEVAKSSSFNFASVFSLLLIFVAIYLLIRVIRNSKSSYLNANSYTAFPAGYINYDNNNTLSIPKDFESAMSLPKFSMKKSLKTADINEFSCFDIPSMPGKEKPFSVYKSVIKKTSESLKFKTLKDKHSNPILQDSLNSVSELDIPVVEDINTENKKEVKNEPELLSVLNLAPNKGFYLTTVEGNAFGLFGFVNDNIFLLKKFNDLSQINLQARYYDRNIDKDVYIVRMDSYKAMVEVSEKGMQELAVL